MLHSVLEQASAAAGGEVPAHGRRRPRDLNMTKNAIDDCMRASVEQYLHDLRGAEPGALHDLFLGAAERPLLEVVLRHAQGNQSKAAEWLGINRNTLRRKLLNHKLIK
jgi:Fis family transcriptional regulator